MEYQIIGHVRVGVSRCAVSCSVERPLADERHGRDRNRPSQIAQVLEIKLKELERGPKGEVAKLIGIGSESLPNEGILVFGALPRCSKEGMINSLVELATELGKQAEELLYRS